MTRSGRAALMLLTLAVVGCGGTDSEPNLASAVERSQAVGTAKIAIDAVEAEGGQEISLSCEGAADYGRDRIQLRCRYGTNIELRLIAIRDLTYVRFSDNAVGGSAGPRWERVEADSDDPSLQDLGPEKLFSLLRTASSDMERVGTEFVREAETVRYRLTVDCREAKLECEDDAEVEVWLDDAGVLRKIWLDDDTSVGAIEFFDFGEPVAIEPPPADQVAKPGATASRCGDREAKPIGVEEASATLREHGFSVQISCGPEPVAAVLSNTGTADPAQVLEREGQLSCFLFVERRSPRAVVVRGADGADAELKLANLTCQILADSPRSQEKIRPLREAFDELHRAVRP